MNHNPKCKIFIEIGLLDLRDIEVLYQPEVDFLNLKTQKIHIFLKSKDRVDYKNINCFRIRAKLRNLAKICKFCKFRSAILNT